MTTRTITAEQTGTIDGIEVLSFGYKYGFPENATLLFDVRFLANPHYNDHLRQLTGADRPVQQFIEAQESCSDFLESVKSMVRAALPGYLANRRRYGKLVIAFGCTGGKHRSRYYAIKTEEFLKQLLDEQSIELPVTIVHRDSGLE